MAAFQKQAWKEAGLCEGCGAAPGEIHKLTCSNVNTTFVRAEGGRDPLLAERQKTHGSFQANAQMSQRLKNTFQQGQYLCLSDVHKEALDMIALKISRILSGQAGFRDHWDDIAGYARLGSEACGD